MSYIKKLFYWNREAAKVIKGFIAADVFGAVGWCIVGIIALLLYIFRHSEPIIIVPIAFGIALIYGIVKLVKAICAYRNRQDK